MGVVVSGIAVGLGFGLFSGTPYVIEVMVQGRLRNPIYPFLHILFQAVLTGGLFGLFATPFEVGGATLTSWWVQQREEA